MRDLEPLLARADVYRILALAFVYPDDETLESMRDGEANLVDALEHIGADADVMNGGLEFVNSAAQTQPKDARRNYNDLFVGRQQCSLDESEYDKSIFYRHQRIADIAGFYRAFGFEQSEESHQRPDFVGAELEFMHLLLFKEAYALEQGWDDKAESCRDAEGKFFHEHLEWWIPQMCERLRGASSCAYYISLSNFLESFIQSEAMRFLQPA